MSDTIPIQRRHLFLESGLASRLDEFKRGRDLRSRTAALATLLNEAAGGKEVPEATPTALLADTRPLLLVGPSGSGKTTSLKALLGAWMGSCLVLDASDEYTDLERVADSRGIDWAKGGRLRIVTSPDEEYSKIEAAYLFRDLNRLKTSGVLKPWVIVVEEGHRFVGDENLRALVLEARKFTRKLVVATADAGPLDGLAPVYSPSV